MVAPIKATSYGSVIPPSSHSVSDVVPIPREGGSSSSSSSTLPHKSSHRNKEAKPRHPYYNENLETFAGVAGNILELQDFAVFGYFSDVIGKVFFPPDQPGNAALIEAFVVFGGAFLMRPLGGVLMGYLGDVYGRKTALEVSIFLMAFPTFTMGLLPSYARCGAISYILLVVVRLLQGLSVGGQLMSSLVFTLEGKPKKKWGLLGAGVMASACFGTLMGGVMGFLVRGFLSESQVESWGWRLPFLSGISIVFCGLYLRICCPEPDSLHGHHVSLIDDDDPAHHPKNPIKLAFARKNRRQLAAACLVSALWSGGFYLVFVWMAIFMLDLTPHSIPGAMQINAFALLFSCCLFFPLAGSISDKYGRRSVMTVGGISFGVLSPLMIVLIGQGNPYVAFLCQCVMGLSLSLWSAPMCAWLVENFAPEARLTSAAVGYNIGQAMIGGLTPALATYMVKFDYRLPGLLLTGLSIMALVGLWIVAPDPPELQQVQELAELHPLTGSKGKSDVEPNGEHQA